MKRLEFVFPLPPAKLRRNHGQGKFLSVLRADYSELMYAEALSRGWWPPAPSERLRGELEVHVDWSQTGPGDADNCGAGAKVVLDALGCAPGRPGQRMTYLGVYEDDAQVRTFCVTRIQVDHKVDEQLTIRIKEVEHGSPEG